MIVDLRVDGEVVIITQDSEEIGVWDVDDVDAERLNGHKFRLLLGGDEVIFHARDRLGFAYNGLNALSEAKKKREEQRNKWWFERLVDPEADRPSGSELVGKGLAKLSGLGPAIRSMFTRDGEVPADEPMPTAPAKLRAVADPEPEPPVSQAPARPAGGPSALRGGSGVAPAPDPQPEPTEQPAERPPADAQPARTRRAPKRRDRQASQRTSDEQPAQGSDDPWSMATGEMLRRSGDAEAAATVPAPAKPAKRRRTRRDHTHQFEETRLPGGLVRRVCSCGEVVIRSVD